MSTENNKWGQSHPDSGSTGGSEINQQEGSRWHKEYQRTGGGMYNTGNQSHRGRGRGRGRGGSFNDNGGFQGGRGGYRGRGGQGSYNNRTVSNNQQSQPHGNWQHTQAPSNSSGGWNTTSVNSELSSTAAANSNNSGWSTPSTTNSNNSGWSTVAGSKQTTSTGTTNEGWSTSASAPANEGWGTKDTGNGQWSSANNSNETSSRTNTSANTGWASTAKESNDDAWSKPAEDTSDGWSTVAATKNTDNDTWANTTATTSTKDSWSTSAAPSKDSWSTSTTPSKDSWGASATTTTDAQTDSWSSGMTTGPAGWNPSEVSWMKTMNEPEKKETGRGEWKDGKHIIADRDIETEKKLFGETEADFIHSGINFDQYDNIPIKVQGETVFDPMNTFTSPPLNDHLLSNIKLAQYSKPTPVQKYSVPIVMSGRDLMACAQTGSGKTAGFLFPILSRLFNEGPREVVQKKSKDGSTRDSRKAYPEVLILAPTRELASQIYKETKKFCYRSFARPCVAYGGADIGQQLRLLGRGCQVLVATPGRLVDILERRRLSLKNIQYLVLDEADRMLDMGFEPQIRRIVQGEDMPEPIGRQTLMFSATFPKSIQALAKEFLNNYVFFTVGKVGGASENIKQEIINVEDKDKRSQLLETLDQTNHGDGLTLVFVETKRMADSLCEYLVGHGKRATSIHGDRLQREREEALQAFKSGEVPILVATSVASRGLDIPNVTHVISYDVPKDIDDYTHRIGRTGRAGNTGLATAFFERRNRFIAADLVDLLKEAKQTIPNWLQEWANEPLPVNNFDDYPKRRQQRNYDADDGIGVRIKNLKF